MAIRLLLQNVQQLSRMPSQNTRVDSLSAPVLTREGEQVAVDDLVFITRFGNPFDAPTVTHRFQALLTRAGIGHHRFHDLRHTAAMLTSSRSSAKRLPPRWIRV